MADQSDAYPEGVIEDVLVKVNELIFPADFYILHMKDSASLNLSPILLGRPFLKTSKTKIDVDKRKLTMEFDGEIIAFDVFKEIQTPNDNQSISTINMINFFDVQEPSKLKGKSNSKYVKGRSSINDATFKGRKYKRRSYAQGSSYFPT